MNDFVNQTATELVRRLEEGEVSSEELTRAHLDRIDSLDRSVRAFTQVFREEALASARRSDEERRNGQARGPLHGLPMTIKESLDMAGCASTLGIVKRKNAVAVEDAAIVDVLRRAGVVFLGRTNVSQLLLFHESRNPLFGQTSNPWSPRHTPGGSSGGEAAAIAARMSPLGIGTDIGGSIRVPAHFTGIAGLKPTLDRWPNKGSNSALLGQETIRSQLGPMARSSRDLALVFGALSTVEMTKLDARVPPLASPRPESVDVARLRVGIYVDDGMLPVSSAVSRAVREAGEALRARGADVVPFTPEGIPDAIYAYFAALSSDGGATAIAALEGSLVDPSLASLKKIAKLPNSVRKSLAKVMRLAREGRLARFLEALGDKPVSAYWQLTAVLRTARFALEASMRKASIDLLLCAPHATPALPHMLSRDFVIAGSPSIFHNITQFPAGVVPVTTVSPKEASRVSPRDSFEKRAAEVDRASAGLPVGVQVVGLPWREDVVLSAMIAIEDASRLAPGFPAVPPDPA